MIWGEGGQPLLYSVHRGSSCTFPHLPAPSPQVHYCKGVPYTVNAGKHITVQPSLLFEELINKECAFRCSTIHTPSSTTQLSCTTITEYIIVQRIIVQYTFPLPDNTVKVYCTLYHEVQQCTQYPNPVPEMYYLKGVLYAVARNTTVQYTHPLPEMCYHKDVV